MATLLLALDPDQVPPSNHRQVRDLAPDYRLVVANDRADIEAHLSDIEIVAGWLPSDLLMRMPGLVWYQQWGAGADWLLRNPDFRASQVILTNASGVHPVQIGEHVFALLLAFARRLPAAFDEQRRREWTASERVRVFELEGKTMLIVGVGAIGARVAQLAQAFGMEVVGVRRDPGRRVAGVDAMLGPEDLNSALPAADVVVLTLPYTETSRHLFGERELALMKDDACLINIGRGGTIDEEALARALAAGRFAGVGLDVFEHEPLPADSPLWDQERVIVTAHYAGLSPRYHERAFAIFLDNLGRFLAGRELQRVVDKARGY